jgi:hypothetical protein
LRGGGAVNFAEKAGRGGAPAEERGGGAGAHLRARLLELSGMSSTALRGCCGTCVRVRKHTE